MNTSCREYSITLKSVTLPRKDSAMGDFQGIWQTSENSFFKVSVSSSFSWYPQTDSDSVYMTIKVISTLLFTVSRSKIVLFIYSANEIKVAQEETETLCISKSFIPLIFPIQHIKKVIYLSSTWCCEFLRWTSRNKLNIRDYLKGTLIGWLTVWL